MHLSDAYSVLVASNHFVLSLSVSILLNEALGDENVFVANIVAKWWVYFLILFAWLLVLLF